MPEKGFNDEVNYFCKSGNKKNETCFTAHLAKTEFSESFASKIVMRKIAIESLPSKKI